MGLVTNLVTSRAGGCGRIRPRCSSALLAGRHGVTRHELIGERTSRPGQRAVASLGQRDGAPHRRAGPAEGDGDEGAVLGHRDGGDDGRAEAGGDEGEDARHLAALADQVRFDPRGGAGVERDRPQVVALAEHHQVQPVEVAHPYRGGDRRTGARAP